MKTNIKFVEVIPSTNLYLKENYNTLDNLFSIVSRHQTAGRGRLGRSWNDNDDLLMSILIKEDLKLEKIENLSLVICASIYKVLKKYIRNIKIKWPNDILVNEKKICGILLESVICEKLEALIIGFGINVNSKTFSLDINNKATSLLLETNKEYDIKKLSFEIYEEFIKDFKSYKNGSKEYLEICKLNSCLQNKEIMYVEDKKIKFAIVRDILENGHILLEKDNTLFEKSSGEITLHYNYEQNDLK